MATMVKKTPNKAKIVIGHEIPKVRAQDGDQQHVRVWGEPPPGVNEQRKIDDDVVIISNDADVTDVIVVIVRWDVAVLFRSGFIYWLFVDIDRS